MSASIEVICGDSKQTPKAQHYRSSTAELIAADYCWVQTSDHHRRVRLHSRCRVGIIYRIRLCFVRYRVWIGSTCCNRTDTNRNRYERSTRWHPLCHVGTVINFWHPGTLTLSLERQSARMSKITNDGLTLSGTECFIAVPTWQQWASKG